MARTINKTMTHDIIIGQLYTYRPLFGSSAPSVFQQGETVRVVLEARFNAETEKTGYYFVTTEDGVVGGLVSAGSLRELDRS